MLPRASNGDIVTTAMWNDVIDEVNRIAAMLDLPTVSSKARASFTRLSSWNAVIDAVNVASGVAELGVSDRRSVRRAVRFTNE